MERCTQPGVQVRCAVQTRPEDMRASDAHQVDAVLAQQLCECLTPTPPRAAGRRPVRVSNAVESPPNAVSIPLTTHRRCRVQRLTGAVNEAGAAEAKPRDAGLEPFGDCFYKLRAERCDGGLLVAVQLLGVIGARPHRRIPDGDVHL
jgi:hypothetical protein